ncbi:MAG TPA: NAD-dependent epimerase [Flavobacteriales bacterium]|jgi:nucleoside-diphosphate-sugar epimerase|nr:NAD-dependent epimerase [Flavobacteriales bacterium]
MKILVIGALGQVGSELVGVLQEKYGLDQVIASDIRDEAPANWRYEKLDVLDKDGLRKLVIDEKIDWIFNLAAMLSATAEQNVDFAWKLNMEGHLNTLNLAKEGIIKRLFWPSSIAVFGPSTPKDQTPQRTIMDPNTVYGISKLAGERWNAYYHEKFGVDVRSIRYPGLIGWKSLPGGGTTDYAVDIFHQARKTGSYESFLDEHTALPMMMMEDAVRATIEIMEAPDNEVKVRESYNLSGTSFNPDELTKEIKKHLPDFSISYAPDNRDIIAQSWPHSIDDAEARKDWGWNHKYGISELVVEMLEHI